MRIVAVLTSFNEARFLPHILDHYDRHGIEVFILDNESTDDSVEIARSFMDRNVIGVETMKRPAGRKDWLYIVSQKEDAIERLKADWFIHADPDEFRVPPREDQTLAQAIAEADQQGYNAVNFMEYTFVPTQEHPDHDNDRFLETMRWYYPFCPNYPNRLNAWRQPVSGPPLMPRIKKFIKTGSWRYPKAGLVASGGHRVSFPGIKQYPVDFKMRHYILLSMDHAVRKYINITVSPNDPEGMHGWRRDADIKQFLLPPESDLRYFTRDDELDPSNPEVEHVIIRRVREGSANTA